MSDLYWLTNEQMERLRPFFPRSCGRPHVDDQRVLSGLIFANRNGLRWRDAPKTMGLRRRSTTAGNVGAKRVSFVRMMEGLAAANADPSTLMIDTTYQKAHRTASSLAVKWGLGRLIGRTKGGMNTKLHSVADANGRPLSFFLNAGPVSDYTGAAASLDGLLKAQWLLGDRGYDAGWFRDALAAKGIKPCIPGRKSRNAPVKHDKRRYRRCNRMRSCSGD